MGEATEESRLTNLETRMVNVEEKLERCAELWEKIYLLIQEIIHENNNL